MKSLNEMLKDMVDNNGSDLHLTVGSPPRIRINGDLIKTTENTLTPENLSTILENELTEDRICKLEVNEDVDFSIGIKGISRFRVNIFKQRGNLAATFRRLPYKVPTLQSLNLPDIIGSLTLNKKGLILITGGTGSFGRAFCSETIAKYPNVKKIIIIKLTSPTELLKFSENRFNLFNIISIIPIAFFYFSI